MSTTVANVQNDHAPNPNPITALLLDKQALAKRLGLSVRTLESMVKSKTLPQGVRVGRFLYWTAEVVNVWEQHRFGAQKAWRP